jgi:hypothetical protein
MTAPATPCRWLLRIWILTSVLWLAFVGWGMTEKWPAIPLDMGGADPSTDAAYQAAQLQHVARSLGLAVAVPVITFLIFKIICRTRR